ncbi:MAG: ATP-dependent DNA helicase, partial [Kaistella sp.]
SNIFDELPSEPRFYKKKEEKKTLQRNEPLAIPQNLKPVATARIVNPSGTSSQDIEVGDQVRHDRFGVGEVIFLDGTDEQNIKAKVKFQHEGEKNLILKFAKLTKI